MPSPVLSGLLLCLALLTSALPAQAADLRLHGSNTVGAQLAPALVRAWLAEQGYRDIRTETLAEEERRISARRPDGGEYQVEIHSHGSGTAFTGLRDGRADIGLSSRPVSRSELDQARALGALDRAEQEVVIALDGLAVVVHPANPLDALTVEQIRGLFSGQIRDWSALGRGAGPVRLHARDAKSGTFDTFRSLVMAGADVSDSALRYESNDEIAAQVMRDPQAVGFVGLAAVGRAKALQVREDGTLPLPLPPLPIFVATEDYPLARRLFLYLPENALPEARSLIRFAVSEAGQRIVEEVGYVSQNLVALDVPRRPDAGADYLALTTGALRLSLNFRFGTGATLLDNKALGDLERLAAFMRGPERQRWHVHLIGFADAKETFPYLAETLSNDRVDHVAEELVKRGVTPRRVRGLGGVAPVASNETEAGRNRNRRVEVWVVPPA